MGSIRDARSRLDRKISEVCGVNGQGTRKDKGPKLTSCKYQHRNSVMSKLYIYFLVELV